IVSDGAVQNREARRGPEVGGRGGRSVIEEAAAEPVAAVGTGGAGATDRLVARHWAAQDGERRPCQVRDATTPRSAAVATIGSLAADGLVIRDRAVAYGVRATPGETEGASIIRRKPTALANPHESAARVTVAADGPVVAEHNVPEGQANG